VETYSHAIKQPLQCPSSTPFIGNLALFFYRFSLLLCTFRYFLEAAGFISILKNKSVYDILWILSAIASLFQIGFVYYFARSRFLLLNFATFLVYFIYILGFILKFYSNFPLPGVNALSSIWWVLFAFTFKPPRVWRSITLRAYAFIIAIESLLYFAIFTFLVLLSRPAPFPYSYVTFAGTFSNTLALFWFGTYPFSKAQTNIVQHGNGA